MKKKDIKELVRKEVFSFQPYIPGKPIAELERELRQKGVKVKNIIKLASNENPLGPSKKAISALERSAKNIYFYPESSCPELRKKLAKKLQVKPENLIFGNGSDEIIELIGKVFLNPEDEIIVSEHAFIRYQMAGDLMGSKVVTVPMTPYPFVIANSSLVIATPTASLCEAKRWGVAISLGTGSVKQSRFSKGVGFTHDLVAMAQAVTPKTKAIFIANPNNPTGTYNTADEMESFFNHLSTMPLVIIDEAYYEYAKGEKDYPDTLKYFRGGKNIIILRTFSKIYGLAGLRIGYGIAKKEIIDFLERIRPPFNVNSLAQEAALASLDDGEQIKKSIQLVKEGKKYLYQELKKLGLNYVPSAANFILIEMKKEGKKVFTELLEQGVIVRAMEEYGFPEYIRVTIGLPEENRKFIQALKKVISIAISR